MQIFLLLSAINVYLLQILPAIKEKWPSTSDKNIYIQQDNAKPHIKDNDPTFREAADKDGFKFTLIQQPPNSPDLNVNDLGWFRSIEQLQTNISCVTVDQLLAAVIKSFNDLDHTTLNNVFLSLQGCMIEIMQINGCNNYKLPHMGKEALIRAGTLPINLDVSHATVKKCLTHMLEVGDTEAVEEVMKKLDMQTLEQETVG